MRQIRQSTKLQNVRYDVRGPILVEAQRLEAEGHRILKLNIGNPAPFGFEAPDAILQDMIHNLPQAQGYSDSRGIYSARTAVASFYQSEGMRDVDVDDVYIGNGVSEMITMVLQALVDNGDEILVPAPDYPLWTGAVSLAGGTPVHYLCDEDNGWMPDLADIEARITPATKALVIINPNNPTGAVYSRETLAAVNALCRQRGLYHISDEAYEYFVFGGRLHFSPASLPDSQEHTLSLFSFSKAYGMASWRVGYLVAPAHLQTALEKAQDTDLICPPVISQYAALGALEAGTDFWRPRVAALAEVRALVLAELGRLDSFCTVPEAHGAFYFWLKLATSLEPLALVERLVREFGVAAIPGTTFGLAGACTLRIAYGALERETVAEGVGRLVRGLNQIVGQPRGDRRTQPFGAQPPGGAAGAPDP
mgnify:CR=1 FL=1